MHNAKSFQYNRGKSLLVRIWFLTLILALTGCHKETDTPAQPPAATKTPPVSTPERQSLPGDKTPPIPPKNAAEKSPLPKQAQDASQAKIKIAKPEPNKLTDKITAIQQKWPRPRSTERLFERQLMVNTIGDLYGLNDPKILKAMEQVPRHWFVPSAEQGRAYADMPLPIEEGQTISQPYIVAYMTSLLELDENKKVLEVGTGSGYQAAVLNEFTPQVYTIEINESLGRFVLERFRKLGYPSIKTKIGDGYQGWKENGPYDAIIVTCAAEHIPPSLIEQLKNGGKMCIPVGQAPSIQNLLLINKDADGKISQKSLLEVRFVPLLRIK